MILDKFSPQIVMHSDGLKKEDTIQKKYLFKTEIKIYEHPYNLYYLY